jgi:hypothetical protein
LVKEWFSRIAFCVACNSKSGVYTCMHTVMFDGLYQIVFKASNASTYQHKQLCFTACIPCFGFRFRCHWVTTSDRYGCRDENEPMSEQVRGPHSKKIETGSAVEISIESMVNVPFRRVEWQIILLLIG